MKDLTFVYPKHYVLGKGNRLITPQQRAFIENEATKGNKTVYNTYNNGANKVKVFRNTDGNLVLCEMDYHTDKKYASQIIKTGDDVQVKKTRLYRDGQEFCSSVQIQDKASGRYSVTRLKDGKVVGGYEVHPVERKLMTGFKGKVEALAMKIGTNSNGCERPVLRRVSGFMLDLLRKIK